MIHRALNVWYLLFLSVRSFAEEKQILAIYICKLYMSIVLADKIAIQTGTNWKKLLLLIYSYPIRYVSQAT